MKKFIFILAAIFITTFGFMGCDPKPDEDTQLEKFGDGSPNNPFKVATVADLQRVGTDQLGPEGLSWGDNKHYKQIKDIDLNSVSNWKPICGAGTSWFHGSYNGDGFTISNLKISGNEESVGLFGNASGTISNVRLNNVSISGRSDVGALVGHLWDGGKIEYCSVNNVKIFGKYYVGGLTGFVYGSSSVVSACMVTNGTITVEGGSPHGYIGGGIAGKNSGTISNCYTTVNVIGELFVGGITGGGSGTIQCCYTTGNVTGIKGPETGVGGIAGEHDNAKTLQNCVALNPKVKKQANGFDKVIGRITATHKNGGILKNNYARTDMICVTGGEEASVPMNDQDIATGIHGANVDAINYCGENSDTWWSSTAGFLTTAWTFSKNCLPHLKGFEGLTQNPTVEN